MVYTGSVTVDLQKIIHPCDMFRKKIAKRKVTYVTNKDCSFYNEPKNHVHMKNDVSHKTAHDYS